MIIADASLLAHLLIPGLDKTLAESVLNVDSAWRAPRLWQYQLKNVLLKYIRAGVITEQIAEGLMFRALNAMNNAELQAHSSMVIPTALTFGISAYDAEYVALARELGIFLITYDRKLVRAAPGVALLPADYVARQ